MASKEPVTKAQFADLRIGQKLEYLGYDHKWMVVFVTHRSPGRTHIWVATQWELDHETGATDVAVSAAPKRLRWP